MHTDGMQRLMLIASGDTECVYVCVRMKTVSESLCLRVYV